MSNTMIIIQSLLDNQRQNMKENIKYPDKCATGQSLLQTNIELIEKIMMFAIANCDDHRYPMGSYDDHKYIGLYSMNIIHSQSNGGP